MQAKVSVGMIHGRYVDQQFVMIKMKAISRKVSVRAIAPIMSSTKCHLLKLRIFALPTIL